MAFKSALYVVECTTRKVNLLYMQATIFSCVLFRSDCSLEGKSTYRHFSVLALPILWSSCTTGHFESSFAYLIPCGAHPGRFVAGAKVCLFAVIKFLVEKLKMFNY